MKLLRHIAPDATLENKTKKEYKKMNSSFLTKHLSKLTLAINLTITILIWLYFIGTDNPSWYSILQGYAFISIDTAKIIITVVCAAWIIKSITSYELKTVLFTQADIQKEILKELQLLRNGKQMNNADAMKDDFRIDFDKVDC